MLKWLKTKHAVALHPDDLYPIVSGGPPRKIRKSDFVPNMDNPIRVDGTPFVGTSGIEVNMQNPRAEQIDLVDIIIGLSNTPMYQGQTNKFYSIAQHNLLVASRVPEDCEKWAALMENAHCVYVGNISQNLAYVLPDYQQIRDRFRIVIQEKFDIQTPRIIGNITKEGGRIRVSEHLDLLEPSEHFDPYSFGPLPIEHEIKALNPDDVVKLMMAQVVKCAPAKVQRMLRIELSRLGI